MTKILWVGDVHAADQAVSRRTEDYRENILDKLREIVEIAKRENVTDVIFAGDIFHYKEPRKVSHRLLAELIDIFRSFGIKVYILVGNHDITMGQLRSLEKQPLGILGRLENVHLLEWDVVKLGNVTIHPIPGIPNVTVEDYKIEKRDTEWNVIISHQSVVPDKSKEMAVLRNKPFIHDSTEVAELTDADMVLYGHQHRRDGIYMRNDKLFVNLGSICRGTITEEDLNKEPAVFVVDFSEGNYNYHEVKLESVRPAEEVFNLDDYFEGKANKQDIQDAIDKFKETAVQSFSIEAVIADIQIKEGVEEKVRDRALELLEHVR
ncbi:MAG: metallophosphoesterase [Candidatus Bathyarchaeota archaeon]|nr:metallophosphoesterase [Candidatus Bathyarchaeota archaeon]